MSQSELLKVVVETLQNLEVSYMITGSLASSAQGEPRSTHDIDIVIKLNVQQIPDLLSWFPPPDYYLSEMSVRDALKNESMFNLLHIPSGDKIDFWILKTERYDQCRFDRKMKDDIEETAVFVSAPEDTILMKLKWAIESGGSEKQFQDALRVYEVQAGMLDTEYMTHWIEELGIQSLWKKLLELAEPLD